MASPKYQQVAVTSTLDEQDTDYRPAGPTYRSYNGANYTDTRDSPSAFSPSQNTGDHSNLHHNGNVKSERIIEREIYTQPRSLSSPSRFSLLNDWWLLEIVGALLSLAWLAAMVAVLYLYKNKPLSQWNLPIKINSLISLFATLSKACLLLPIAACINQLKWRHFAGKGRRLFDFSLFDNASRGPLGALELVLHLNRASFLASFAALITIVALAIDPFSQQIISYPSRPGSFANNSASISETQIYDTGLDASNRQASSVFTDIQMQGSIYRGLFGLPNATVFTCPTANCDWEPFATFGVCSECTDVTDNTQRSCFNYTSTATGVQLDPTNSSRSDWPLMCNYTTPSNFNLWAFSGMSGVGPWSTSLNSTAQGTNVTSNASTIVSTATLRIPIPGEEFAIPMGEITECQLYWCARTYNNVKVRNGALSAGDLTTFKLNKYSTIPWFLDDKSMMVLKVDANETVNFNYNNTFTINSNDWYTTSYFLLNVFTTSRYTAAAYNYNPGVLTVSSAVEQAPTVDDLMSRVANSMTDRMRSISNGTQHFGTAATDVTYIHVRWGWLILPASLIVSGCILLVVVICLTSRPGSPIWQSNSLAPMFHGLHDGRVDTGNVREGSAGVPTKTNTDMNEAAKEMRVQLMATGAGKDEWKLVKLD